jgi:hypothetical protein
MRDSTTGAHSRRCFWTPALLLVLVPFSLGAVGQAAKPAEPRPASAPAAEVTKALAAPARAHPRSPLGYNLDFPGDWTYLRPFIDLMHNARPWTGTCAEDDPRCDRFAHLSLDRRGWPRTLAYRDRPSAAYAHVETVFSTITTGPDIGKVFVVTWDGAGEIDIFGAATLSTDAKGRRITFKLQGGNLFLRILRTQSEDHVRNVRIFRQDLEPLLAKGEIFNPEMLAYLEPFGSLRFMDWMLSNDAEERDAHWSERPRADVFPWIRQPLDLSAPCDASERPACRRIGGYPVEILVELANRLGADAHFNMPYRADGDWISKFAAYVRDHLAPDLVATVEYSNEVWNWSFPQAAYAKAQAQKLWPGEGSGWLQYMGSRAARTCRVWKAVFQGQEKRVRCVLAPQTGWPDTADASLDCPAWVSKDPKHRRPCHEGMDALAITGYFGHELMAPNNTAVLRAWLGKGQGFARDRAFRYLEQGEGGGLLDGEGKPLDRKTAASANATIASFARWKTIADERHLALYVYEGGTHFGSNEADLRAFLASVANDPRMTTLYRRVLDGYRKAGGTVWNAWGALGPGDAWSNGDSLADRSNAKYRALVDFARANPCWWPGCDRSAR